VPAPPLPAAAGLSLLGVAACAGGAVSACRPAASAASRLRNSCSVG
jgi:hypothetical protein